MSARADAYALADALIERSSSHDEITHAPYTAALAEALAARADDSVSADEAKEYWGGEVGREWRVHLDRAARGDA